MAANKPKLNPTKSSPTPIVVKPAGNAPGTMRVQNVEIPSLKGKIRELKKS